MRILTAGGAGFIGSHLVRALLAAGWEVTVLDNLSTGLKENLPDGTDFIEADVRDEETVRRIMLEGRYDAAVNLAGQTMVDASIKNPRLDAEENILGTVNLLGAMCRAGVKRFVFASTAAAYGNVAAEDLPILENSALAPMSFYGLSKVTAERYLALYREIFGIDYVVLRFANVYGERQGDGGEGGVISIFTKRLAKGEDITIFGDGEQTRDFVYAGDIAAGIMASLVTKNVNTAYNLSSCTETSLRQLVSLLAQIAGRDIVPHYAPERTGDIRRSVLSNQRAVRGLNWQAATPLIEGLKKTYEYFAARAGR